LEYLAVTVPDRGLLWTIAASIVKRGTADVVLVAAPGAATSEALVASPVDVILIAATPSVGCEHQHLAGGAWAATTVVAVVGGTDRHDLDVRDADPASSRTARAHDAPAVRSNRGRLRERARPARGYSGANFAVALFGVGSLSGRGLAHLVSHPKNSLSIRGLFFR
jgi:hypothetical protein